MFFEDEEAKYYFGLMLRSAHALGVRAFRT